jgi:RNA polymerase sigma factor (sigma-70 family)
MLIRSSANNSQNDDQLIAAFKQYGDHAVIEILFNRYCQLVFAVAMKYLHNEDEAKDTVIEVFEKVPADLKRYAIQSFSSWLYIVTKNLCYHKLKKAKKDAPVELSENRLAEIANEASDDYAFTEEVLLEHLEESLLSLNAEQQLCIRLFYLEKKSYEEVEQQTGFSYKEVKSHIQNGKRNMKNYLKKYLPST